LPGTTKPGIQRPLKVSCKD